MRIILYTIIILFIPFKHMAQNAVSTQKNDNHYIELIKNTFYKTKLEEAKELPFFKSLRYRRAWRKIQNNKTFRYHLTDELADTANQRMVIQIGCDGMPLSEKNNDGRNILALFDTETDSLISILGNNASIGFRKIQLTIDYIIATSYNEGLFAWNRITGEPKGQSEGRVFYGHFITPIIRHENSNKVFLQFGGREPQESFLFDIDEMKKVSY